MTLPYSAGYPLARIHGEIGAMNPPVVSSAAFAHVTRERVEI
jgi:hypothetical protein